MGEVKLLASKGNSGRIRDSFQQMFKKLLKVDKKGLNSDGVDVGSIRRRFAQVACRITNIYVRNRRWP